tara:strand:- start:776 stop:1201 length:426 start_codon:yes stop_codon:yes gene_type:complete
MTIPDWWTGNQPVAPEPSAYRVLRTLSASSASWVEFDVTSNDFAGAPDGLAQQPSNVTNAILRGVSILNNSTAAGEHVNISLYVSGGSPSPAGAYNTAYVSGPSVDLRCSLDMLQNKFWLKADAGNPSVQLEVWYDIPVEV